MSEISQALDQLRGSKNQEEQPQTSNLSQALDSIRGSSQQEISTANTGSFGQVLPRVVGVDSQEDKSNIIRDGFFESIRGFYEGTESLFEKLDAGTKLIEKTTGIKRGGLFGEIAEQQKIAQQVIPETEMGDIGSTIFKTIGAAPSTIAEFAAIPTGKLGGIASFSTKMGVLEALDEFNKEEDLQSLAVGGVKGAATGAAFGISVKLFAKGFDVMKKFGKGAAENWIKLTTGDAKLAKDFVKNPNKYNLNPFGKRKTDSDIRKEFKDEIELAKKSSQRKIEDFKESMNIKKESIRVQSIDAKNSLQNAQKNAESALSDKSRISIENVMETSNKAIEKGVDSVKARALNIFNEAGGKLKLIKDEAGKKVELAIEQTLKTNPGASIKGSTVNNRVRKVVKDNSPFKIERGIAKPRTAASGDESDVKLFNNIMSELRAKSREGFPIGYLQDLKVATKGLANQAFKNGKDQLGRMYSEISKNVNPANIIQRNPVLRKSLKKISDANREFSSLIPKYEESMKHYFVKDSQGNFVPDFSKAFNAIKTNNKPVIRQMQKADLALPKDDRLLPKVRKLVSEIEKINNDNKILIKLAKLKAQKQKKALIEANRLATKKLNKEQRNLSFEKMQEVRSQINGFKEAESKKLDKLIDALEKQEEFLLRQNALNTFVTQGKGFIPTVQRANIFGVVGGSATGNVPLAVSSGVNVGLLSPKMASMTTKPFLKGGGVVADKAKQAIQNETLKKLIGSSLIKEDRP